MFAVRFSLLVFPRKTAGENFAIVCSRTKLPIWLLGIHAQWGIHSLGDAEHKISGGHPNEESKELGLIILLHQEVTCSYSIVINVSDLYSKAFVGSSQ